MPDPYFEMHELYVSSVIMFVYERFRLAFIPLGGSVVIFSPFYKMAAGK